MKWKIYGRKRLLSCIFLEGPRKKHEKPQLGYPFYGAMTEPGSLEIEKGKLKIRENKNILSIESV
jgi:hypothetical protein